MFVFNGEIEIDNRVEEMLLQCGKIHIKYKELLAEVKELERMTDVPKVRVKTESCSKE